MELSRCVIVLLVCIAHVTSSRRGTGTFGLKYTDSWTLEHQGRIWVRLHLGVLEGLNFTTARGRTVKAFKGVPYAAPPEGLLRFQEPQMMESWTETRNATESPEPCVQINLKGEVIGKEDCLYLNIYTPEVQDEAKYPVIVLFPPEGLFSEGIKKFEPTYLMDYDVVIVTVNYRVGVLGFLSTQDQMCKGNFGLKDQLFALSWIQRNIRYLGGNPASVTVLGASTSASHVNALYFTPHSEGLFHRAYLIGGSILNPWAIQKQPFIKALRIGTIFKCNTNLTSELVNCLRGIDAYKLTAAVKTFQKFYSSPIQPFGPSIERKVFAFAGHGHGNGMERSNIFDDFPLRQLQAGRFSKIPLIFSYSQNDGLYPAGRFAYNKSVLFVLSHQWNDYAPYLLDLQDSVSKDKLSQVSEGIKFGYFGSKPIELTNVHNLVQMLSDRLYTMDIMRTALLMATRVPVQIYRFEYRGVNSTADLLVGRKLRFGSAHADDLMYLFNIEGLSNNISYLDMNMASVMQEMLVRYAYTGIAEFNPPIHKWNQLTPEAINFQQVSVLRVLGPHVRRPSPENFWGNNQFWDLLPVNEPWRARATNGTMFFNRLPPAFIDGRIASMMEDLIPKRESDVPVEEILGTVSKDLAGANTNASSVSEPPTTSKEPLGQNIESSPSGQIHSL